MTLSRGGRSSCFLLPQGSISTSWLLWDVDVPHPPGQGTTGTHQPAGTCMSGHKEGQRFSPCELAIVRGEEGRTRAASGRIIQDVNLWVLHSTREPGCLCTTGVLLQEDLQPHLNTELPADVTWAHPTSYGRALLWLYSMCVEYWGWGGATYQVLLFFGPEKWPIWHPLLVPRHSCCPSPRQSNRLCPYSLPGTQLIARHLFFLCHFGTESVLNSTCKMKYTVPVLLMQVFSFCALDWENTLCSKAEWK